MNEVLFYFLIIILRYHNKHLFYAFSYFITIENKSEKTVQLLERFWTIFDSLNNTEIVEGEGVVGQTPVLEPQDTYKYKSGCLRNISLYKSKDGPNIIPSLLISVEITLI